MSSSPQVVGRSSFTSVPAAALPPRIMEIAPRVIADLIMVHMAMLAAQSA
jgi:hypothetical protein